MWGEFALINQGCRLNIAESQKIIEELQKKGWVLKSPESASVIIINSCAVTHRAESDFRKLVRKIRRKNPEGKIIAIGCLVDFNEDEASMADLYLKNSEKLSLPDLLESAGNKTDIKRWKARGFLKVQEGCDLGCTYCIIPKLRGRSKSVPLRDIENRMEEFMKVGYEEVVITGIHLESYGRDLGDKEGFLRLLRFLERYFPEVRFRISSLDPRYLTNELLDYILYAPHIMPSFHLSFQHYSNKILRRMGRGTNKGFMEILERIKTANPYAGVGTDFIVGFPGEDEDDFRKLLDFAEQAPLTYFHVFSFSPRPGTKAAELKPSVPERIMGERSRILRELAEDKKRSFLSSLVGMEIEGTVIREGEALLENYVVLNFVHSGIPSGKRDKFLITENKRGYVEGKPLQNK